MTRARAQASALAERLRELGAEVVEAPAIRTRALEVELPAIGGYDLLCVTSPTGAERLFDHLRDARELAGVTVAAIGPGTARALRAHGIEADVVPERAVAEGLVEALADVPVKRALIARAAEGRDVLIDALRERGAEVDVVALYETVPEPLDDATRAAAAAADYVLFTSASSVRFFAAAGGALAGRGWSRSGPRRARSCARSAPSPTSRPTRTRRTASSPRCSRTPYRLRHEPGRASRTPADRRLDQRARARVGRGRAPRTARSSPPTSRPPGAAVRAAAGSRRPASRSPRRWSCASSTTCCRCGPGSRSPTSPVRTRS